MIIGKYVAGHRRFAYRKTSEIIDLGFWSVNTLYHLYGAMLKLRKKEP